MLRDITIGQHLPGNSVVHRLDPRLKIILSGVYIVMLFINPNPFGLIISILFLSVLYLLAKIPGRMIWRSLKPLLPILVFTSFLNLFFYPGKVLVRVWIFQISDVGLYYAVVMVVRMVCLISGVGLLTYTTSPIVLTDAIERLLSPLAKFGFPAHELAMMMTIALRFIPTLVEETDKIMSAQKARGAELDSGSIAHRIKALIPVLIPLFLSAFRRAEELAMAMECRCYRGGEGRTRLRQLHIGGLDIAGVVVCTVVFVLMGFSGWGFHLIFPAMAMV